MKYIIEKIETEITTDSIGKMSTLYPVSENETIKEIMGKMGIKGHLNWEYSQLEFKLKILME